MATAPARLAAVAAGFALVAALVVAGAAPAGAETAQQVVDLAERAHHDADALGRLRQVQTVDGRPVDYGSALEGANGDDLDRRLDEIARSAGQADNAGQAGDRDSQASNARDEAQRILAGRRFRPSEPPRPLKGAIHRLGQWFEPVLRPLGRLLAPVGRLLLRLWDNDALVGLLAALVIGLAVLVAVRLSRRRARMADGAGAKTASAERLDPADLERQAGEAEARGDLERAFRLRFVAGVLRLDRAGALDYRPSQTTGELVRAVHSATFPRLARAFDEIAYGRRPPQPVDLDQAKADWPKVLEEARR